MYREIRERELAQVVAEGSWGARASEAAELLDQLVLSDEFTEFLTLPGYEKLDTEAA